MTNNPRSERNPDAEVSGRPRRFVEQARLGKNDWWRYVLGLLIYGAVALSGSGYLLGTLFYPELSPDPAVNARAGIPEVAAFAFPMLSYATTLVAVLLVVRFVHARPARTVVTAYQRIRWGRILLALGLWMALMSAYTVARSALDPAGLEFAFDPARFLLFLPFVLVLVPLQTTSEEVFDRGYLLQLLGLRLTNVAALVVIGGLWFGVTHGFNLAFFAQTVGVGPGLFLLFLYYFAFGAFLVWLTLRDNGLELAIGLHAANNLFLSLVVSNPEDVSSGEPALFVAATEDPFALGQLLLDDLVLLALFALFAFVVFGLLGRHKGRAAGAPQRR